MHVTGPSKPPIFDVEDLLERLMGNTDLAGQVLATFLSTMPGDLAALAQAVSRSDAKSTRLAAHSIKGAAANVGGMRLTELARRMEALGRAADIEGARHLLPELVSGCEQFRLESKKYLDRHTA